MTLPDYEAPTWTNGSAPALNATNMQEISDNIEGTQVDVEALSVTVGNHTTAIGTNTDDIADLETTVGDHTTQIGNNTDDIADLETTVGTQGGAITAINTALNGSILTAANVAVTVGSFAADTTYADYNYKATISFAGVTTNHVVSVMFAPTEADSLNYSTFCLSGTNFVYIWSKDVPTSTITIPSIVAVKQTTISA